jgi:hypothetical protein
MVFMTLYAVNIIAETKKKLPYFPNKYAVKKIIQH